MSNKESTCNINLFEMNYKARKISAENLTNENPLSVHGDARESPSKKIAGLTYFRKDFSYCSALSRTLFCTQFMRTMCFDSSYILVRVISAYKVSQFHTAY